VAPPLPSLPLPGSRSAACGRQCAGGRPCGLPGPGGADLAAGEADSAWLRVWAETLVLAFLTSRPVPAVPAVLRRRWSALDERLRECVLATVIDRAVGGRASVLRESYDPELLMASLASVAVRILDGTAPPGARPGPSWVIPQLRWLHEAERVCPFEADLPDLDDSAPPLDYDFAGMASWSDMRVRDRMRALERYPLAMEFARNRRTAACALLGGDGHQGFVTDLGLVTTAIDAAGRLRAAAGMMGLANAAYGRPSWPEVVLSWPSRFIAWYEDGAGN